MLHCEQVAAEHGLTDNGQACHFRFPFDFISSSRFSTSNCRSAGIILQPTPSNCRMVSISSIALLGLLGSEAIISVIVMASPDRADRSQPGPLPCDSPELSGT